MSFRKRGNLDRTGVQRLSCRNIQRWRTVSFVSRGHVSDVHKGQFLQPMCLPSNQRVALYLLQALPARHICISNFNDGLVPTLPRGLLPDDDQPDILRPMYTWHYQHSLERVL